MAKEKGQKERERDKRPVLLLARNTKGRGGSRLTPEAPRGLNTLPFPLTFALCPCPLPSAMPLRARYHEPGCNLVDASILRRNFRPERFPRTASLRNAETTSAARKSKKLNYGMRTSTFG